MNKEYNVFKELNCDLSSAMIFKSNLILEIKSKLLSLLPKKTDLNNIDECVDHLKDMLTEEECLLAISWLAGIPDSLMSVDTDILIELANTLKIYVEIKGE